MYIHTYVLINTYANASGPSGSHGVCRDLRSAAQGRKAGGAQRGAQPVEKSKRPSLRKGLPSTYTSCMQMCT